jgi:hypothetical protein
MPLGLVHWEKSMKTKWLGGMALAIAMAFGSALGLSQVDQTTDSRSDAGNAAFRDGRYQGLLAAQQGKTPHVAAGRWNTDQDQASFARGYHSGYSETLSTGGKDEPMITAAYRDGLFLGSLAAQRRDLPHLSVGRWGTDHDRALFTAGYQQAYPQAVVAAAGPGPHTASF